LDLVSPKTNHSTIIAVVPFAPLCGSQSSRKNRGIYGELSGAVRHYGMKMQRTQPRSPQENGKIEQRHHHHRFKRAMGMS
ncbi:MAG: hypothetical protein OXI05_09900, partial [Bacteroidota bacterium]|nr:hypothetical protein [Bacteroidota bacterium]MDE2646134.1 hypothetical protein [Bacteroidota bacterium]